jgi:hypothetical protein
MSQFTGEIVYRLFSIGLRLENARSIVGKGAANDRIAAAADELERMIRDIRTTIFKLAGDREQPPPARGPD